MIEGASADLLDRLDARGPSAGPLFWPVNKGDNRVKRLLTTQAVYNLLHKRAREAGITKASPHDLRRTFVGDLLDKGVDILTVQRLAGYAQVTTTRYDHRGEAAKARTAELLHILIEG